MSLRPRYSLLSLLVLTALVAGGVKLWYGPHHVVERPTPDTENEYRYTRNWRGEKVIQGARVFRSFKSFNELPALMLVYYRQGEFLPWYYECTAWPKEFQNLGIPFRKGSFPVSPLRADEELDFQKLIVQEKLRMFQPEHHLMETYDNVPRQGP